MRQYDPNDLDSFLRTFLPSEWLLGGTRQTWIFRGQGDAAWGLVSSLFRRRSYAAITSLAHVVGGRGDYLSAAESVEAESLEQAIDQRLFAVLEETGAGVARIEDLARLAGSAVAGRQHAPTPPADERLALAQHLGLPTRLLDWTYSPWVAVYFAAASAAMPGSPERFAVFAMHSTYAHNSLRHRVNAVAAPSSFGNQPMAAQRGLFVRVNEPTQAPDGSRSWDISHGHEVVPTNPRGGGSTKLDDKLVKITAPRGIAVQLLRTMRSWGVYGATAFPGDRGVALAVRELLIEG